MVTCHIDGPLCLMSYRWPAVFDRAIATATACGEVLTLLSLYGERGELMMAPGAAAWYFRGQTECTMGKNRIVPTAGIELSDKVRTALNG